MKDHSDASHRWNEAVDNGEPYTEAERCGRNRFSDAILVLIDMGPGWLLS